MIDAIAGARVVITLRELKLLDPQLRPRVDMLDQETVTIIARVAEADELGIWIEHTDYPYPTAGKKMPNKQHSYILLRYEFITSIAYFPELPAAKPDEQHKIGFVDTTDGSAM